MIKSVTLLGSSSGRNAGDAALMSGIMDAVDAACGRRLLYEIPTINTEFVWNNYTNRVRPVGMMPWNLSLKMLGLPTIQSLLRTDLSLIFDAILFDRALYNPLFNFLSTLYLVLPYAKKYGKKMGMYNVGMGPVTTERGKEMLRSLCEMMDFITIRDEGSYEVFNDLGVKNKNVWLTADAALNVAASGDQRAETIISHLGLDPSKDILALNINKYLNSWSGISSDKLDLEGFFNIYVPAINRFLQENPVQTMFIATQHHDIELTRELSARVQSPSLKVVIDNKAYSHYDIKAVLGKCSLLYAMRLHAIILASAEHTPVLGLAYQPKVHFHFDKIGIGEYCHGFEGFSTDAVYEHLTKGWNERQQIKQTLDREIPQMKELALIAAKLVAAVDSNQDLAMLR